LASGVDVRNKANKIIKNIDEKVNPAYAVAQDKSRRMSAVSQSEQSKKTSKYRETKAALDGYVDDYEKLEKLYRELEQTVNRIFIGKIQGEIEINKNELVSFYYNKIIEQLRNVFIDNEFIIEPVVISTEEFERIKQEFVTFFEKALQSMKIMSSQPYSKETPPQMLDLNGQPVVDKKGNVTLTKGAYNELEKNIPEYERILDSLNKTEDFEEFYNAIKDINEFYNNKISTMSPSTKKVIFWDENIDKNINFIFSLSDIMNHILPNIKTAKSKFASQTNKYDKFKSIISPILEEINKFLKDSKRQTLSEPTKKASKFEDDKTIYPSCSSHF
jgi:hypothetical protein